MIFSKKNDIYIIGLKKMGKILKRFRELIGGNRKNIIKEIKYF